ncbi:hypothetical protein AWN76_000130 [Rhodothermaceae bacterium RA]|nr:hypothetical protein AWN76_000130 [Rhodothermaceae bacterium RA]
MKIALWDHPIADPLADGLASASATYGACVRRHPAGDSADLVRGGQVDLALVPSLAALQDPDAFDVLPAVAVSTWSYPFARIVLRRPLGEPIREVAFDPAYEQERHVARMVLREHYGLEPVFVPRRDVLGREEDAALLVSDTVEPVPAGGPVLDLGQEWYELAQYPMAWGLFVARKGTATASMIRALRQAATAAEQAREAWLEARALPDELTAFYRDSLRYRLDDLVIASLTEWRHHLYFFGLTEDIPNLEFVALPDDEEEADAPNPLF